MTEKPTPTKGVPITLDRQRHLRFPLGTLRNMDESSDVVSVLYLGLKHEDPELTEEQVGGLVDLEMMPTLVEPLRQATGGLINLKVMFGLNGSGPEGGTEGNERGPEAG